MRCQGTSVQTGRVEIFQSPYKDVSEKMLDWVRFRDQLSICLAKSLFSTQYQVYCRIENDTHLFKETKCFEILGWRMNKI